jgi:hypothetical protein
MATWYQGWWTYADGTRHRRPPPPTMPPRSSTPPASGGGTGSCPTATPPAGGGGVRRDLGRLPQQVATSVGHAPGHGLDHASAATKLAQCLYNMIFLTKFHELLVDVDKDERKDRKERSHHGATPTRTGVHSTCAGTKYRDGGNHLYAIVLEVFLKAHAQALGGDSSLYNYGWLSNQARRDERAGDLTEAIIGDYFISIGLRFEGWEAQAWDLTLSGTPLERLVARYIMLHAAVEDYLAVHGQAHITAQQQATFIMQDVGPALERILWWTGNDDGPRRSMAGALRHQSRNDRRAAARREAGVRGVKGGGKDGKGKSKSTVKDFDFKGGKITGGMKGGKADAGKGHATPPAGGGGKNFSNGKGKDDHDSEADSVDFSDRAHLFDNIILSCQHTVERLKKAAGKGTGKGHGTPPAGGGAASSSSAPSRDWATRGEGKGAAASSTAPARAGASSSQQGRLESPSTRSVSWGSMDNPDFVPELRPTRWGDMMDDEPDWD